MRAQAQNAEREVSGLGNVCGKDCWLDRIRIVAVCTVMTVIPPPVSSLMQTQSVWTTMASTQPNASLRTRSISHLHTVDTSTKVTLPKYIAGNVASNQRWLCMKQETASWVENSRKTGHSMGVTLLAAMWAMSLNCLPVTLPPKSSSALASCMHVWQLWWPVGGGNVQSRQTN